MVIFMQAGRCRYMSNVFTLPSGNLNVIFYFYYSFY